MLQPKPLQDLLAQALSSSIHTAVLATPQGTLLAHAINAPSNSSPHAEGPRRQARGLAAIANVIWKSYANVKNIDELWDMSNGKNRDGIKEGLLWTAVECEGGQLLLYHVPSSSNKGLLLALAGDKDAPIGMMRAKAELLAEYLEKPLSEIEIL